MTAVMVKQNGQWKVEVFGSQPQLKPKVDPADAR